MRAAFADIDGIKTRYLYAGDGPGLLVVHPVGLLADCFHRNIDALAEGFSVFVPDLIGHGFTAATDLSGQPPQKQFVSHLQAFAEHVGLSTYAVMGSSLGGLLAALLYRADPDRINGLVIIGSGSTFHPTDDFVRTMKATAANGTKAMQNPTLTSCRTRIEKICFDSGVIDNGLLTIQLTSYALPDRLEAYQAILSGLVDYADDPELRVYDGLEEILTPTLVIQGREDIRSKLVHTQTGIARMPKARLTVYNECGHLPFYEQPQRFNTDVTAFLNSERG